jgi:hypothetical protein
MSAQSIRIKGQVIDATTQNPLPYANLSNLSSNSGGITDAEGYFALELSSWSDQVVVSYIGYDSQRLQLQRGQTTYRIALAAGGVELETVTVRPEDNDYLYELLRDCARQRYRGQKTAKTYYELKTYIDQQQVELVEAFFNGQSAGYDLTELSLKAGRIGLKPVKLDPQKQHFFVSQASSKAILLQQLREASEDFPINPLQLGKRQMKRQFYLDLKRAYRNAQQDSIMLIAFSPKSEEGTHFSGQVWLDAEDLRLLKIKLSCPDAKRHPFVPIFPDDDQIQKMELQLTRTFQEMEQTPYFQQTHFSYRIQYQSRSETNYEVASSAILHAYDYEQAFITPRFTFSDPDINDYYKINALPYSMDTLIG